MTDTDGDGGTPSVHLGRYELVQLLDAGGMAEILLALERGPHNFERVVVVKRALPHLAQKPAFRDMFLQEARWVAGLTHPNIVQIHELGEAEGTAFIAMEHVAGVSFRELVSTASRSGKPVPPGVVVGLLAQACAGAHAAHELRDAQGQLLGLVHRDISPHNLMVTGGGHVKLLDFGIAKATEMGVDTTRPGALKGKVHYMSPEQVQAQRLDRRSDVFALGIVAWELLTLKRLFKRENELATMQAIAAGEAPRPEQVRAGVPPALASAVMQALLVDVEQRFADADQFRRALESAADASALRHGTDEVGEWIREVMGDLLQARAQSLKDAVERAKSGGHGEGTPYPQRTVSQTLPSFSAPGLPPPVQLPAEATAATAAMDPAQLPQQSRPRWVRFLLGGLLFAASVGASAAFVLTRPPELEGPPLKMGWPPTVDRKVLADDIEPLRRHLELQLLRPVEFVHTGSYQELADQLLAGKVHFAALPPALLVRTEKAEPRIALLAMKQVGGSSGTDGVLVAADGAGITSVAALKGKTLCVPDRESTTGMLLPRVAARAVGMDLDKEVTITVSGNHLQVMRDVLGGRCQAGATYSAAQSNAVKQGVDVSALRQVAITGHAPQDGVVAGPTVAAADTAGLKQALLSYRPQGQRPGSGGMEKISGFVTAKPEDFASVRKLLELGDGAN
jgi:phosphate/phosphite/phosphonate ABC transporter binding protein